jgi:hypothetical protein
VKPYVKELADYEWSDLSVFIDRASVVRGTGLSNPTARVRVYRHQIFHWVNRDEAAPAAPPAAEPEVLVFFRDDGNTRRIEEADPLMLLVLEHFKRPGARLARLEAARAELLPGNRVPLERVIAAMRESGLLL